MSLISSISFSNLLIGTLFFLIGLSFFYKGFITMKSKKIDLRGGTFGARVEKTFYGSKAYSWGLIYLLSGLLAMGGVIFFWIISADGSCGTLTLSDCFNK